jgi:hypothetical protein
MVQVVKGFSFVIGATFENFGWDIWQFGEYFVVFFFFLEFNFGVVLWKRQ